MHDEAGIISYVHGNKNRLMKLEDYCAIKSCNTIEELKAKMQATIYGKELLEEAQTTPKSFKVLLYKCLKNQIKTTAAYATTVSKSLIDFYLEHFQLANFIYLWACKQESAKSLEHASNTHPLGNYDGLSFIKVTQGPEDTWKFCLENTSLHKYVAGLSHDILTQDIPHITSILHKRYLELLYEFAIEHKLCLAELVQFEGDRRIIEILHSTLGSSMTAKDKIDLFPRCTTFTEMQKQLLVGCKSLDELKGVLSTHKTYRNVVSSEVGIEDALRREEVRICKKAFYYYDDPSIVFTQLKLQEIEINILVFLAECITQGRQESMEDVLNVEED
ncbi:V-type H+-transporting ATPase subunit d [Nematocida homosporus]|uniref:V-type H+-transporting ATPase subunit d n=1 Tax=Nematocida homosporus TaxID=1912981 RepID=UPI00222022D3|nr:V-type H+-transporting ATPase subunit d [Nematocida homosporus]KAI5186656.1 V-type H+-transporting ATPase subunit d [Nematocida homosporus]